jgi:biotin carboxyl carrier protein
MRYIIQSNDMKADLQSHSQNGDFSISMKDHDIPFDISLIQPNLYSVIVEGRSFVIAIPKLAGEEIHINGKNILLEIQDEIQIRLKEMGWEESVQKNAGEIKAQIPGLITHFFHQVGDEVKQNDALFLMEAMKMENEIKAPISGVIKKINIEIGSGVEKGALIMEIV